MAYKHQDSTYQDNSFTRTAPLLGQFLKYQDNIFQDRSRLCLVVAIGFTTCILPVYCLELWAVSVEWEHALRP